MADPLNIAFVFPSGEIAASFLEVSEAAEDLTVPMTQAAEDFAEDMEKQFKKEGAGRSGKWRGLAPITQEIRSKEGDPPQHPILERSGTLRKSFTKKGAEGHVREITKQSLVIGSDLKVSWGGKSWVLAEIHQSDWTQPVTPRMAAFFSWQWAISLWGMISRKDLEYHERKILFVSPAAIKRMISRSHAYILATMDEEFKGFATVHGRF